MKHFRYYTKFILAFFIISFSEAKIQDTVLAKHIENITISSNINSFKTDAYGHIYTVSQDELVKYNSFGETIINYSFLQVNPPSSFSIRSSGEILVYFKDNSTLYLLDNMLSEILRVKSINTRLEKDILNIAFGFNNHFLMYDRVSNKIIKLNKQLEIQNISADIGTLIETRVEPSEIIFQDNFYYLLYPKSGILQFDVFNNYIGFLPFSSAIELEIFGEYIFYLTQQGQMYMYNLKNFSTVYIQLNEEKEQKIKNFSVQNNTLYLHRDNIIEVYKIN